MRWQLFISCLFLFSVLAAAAENTKINPAPKISFDRILHDFGTVEEGIDVSCNFKIMNVGSRSLHINSVETSCGCTVPILLVKDIAPGASTILKVVMDTSMKQGLVEKVIDVKSNDPLNAQMKIKIKANVLDPHKSMGTDAGTKIFKGRCAACHVLLGDGKLGEDLYMADCAMCHGFRAKGGVGPSLLLADYKNDALRKHIKQVIEEGSKTHRSMPGFLKDKGGPLTNEQVDSLMSYLSWRADLERGKGK